MKRLFLLLGLLWATAAAAQQNTNVNPAPGSVWTYLGATYGAGWVPPAGLVPPVGITGIQTGPITIDGGMLTVATRSSPGAQEIFNQAVMSGSPTIFQSFDALRGVAIANANSTVNTVTGVAGYTRNDTVPVGQRSQTSALFGVAVCVAAPASCWGIDTIVSDNISVTNTAPTSGAGKYLYAAEFDANITNPNVNGAYIQVGGTASLPPNTNLNFSGINVLKLFDLSSGLPGTALITNAFAAADACCVFGLVLGSAGIAGTTNKASMPIVFNYRDGSGTLQNLSINTLGGLLEVGGTNGWGYESPSGAGGPNAYVAGALATSGSNVASQASLWNYRDGAGTVQDYAAHVTNTGVFTFNSSAGGAAVFDFEGKLSVGGTLGVSCSGITAGTFVSINGVVTHC